MQHTHGDDCLVTIVTTEAAHDMPLVSKALCLCLQVGQVILTLPNAYSTTGLAAGVFFQLIFASVALWTLFLLATLYQEFRRRRAAWRRDLHHGIIMVTSPLC